MGKAGPRGAAVPQADGGIPHAAVEGNDEDGSPGQARPQVPGSDSPDRPARPDPVGGGLPYSLLIWIFSGLVFLGLYRFGESRFGRMEVLDGRGTTGGQS